MIADLVQDTTTTTGTGNITLSGSPVAGFQALSALGGVGVTFGYWIGAGSEWEVGTGTITAANTFSRAPTASSNGGALVAFSAGTKTFRHVVTASQFSAGMVDPADVGFDVIGLWGQSKMAGRGTIDAVIDVADSRIWQYGGAGAHISQIFQAVDPLAHPDGSVGVGPGMAAARAYVAARPANRRVLLVPVAEGGTAMVGATWAPGTPGGARFEFYISQMQAALASAQALYPNSRIVGAFGDQGEQDGYNFVATGTPTQAQYVAAKKLFYSISRTRLSAPAMWFVEGGIIPEAITDNAGWNGVRLAQEQACVETDKTYFVAAPAGMTSDRVHLTAAGSRLHGTRMGLAARLAAIYSTTPVPASALLLSLNTTSVAQGTPVTATIGFDHALTTGQSYSAALTAPVAGSWSVNPVVITYPTQNATSVFTPSATGGPANVTAAATGLTGASASLTVTAADTTAPVFGSAQVANANPDKILITFTDASGALAASIPGNSSLTPSGGRTVTGVSIAGLVATVTVNTPYAAGDTITIAYTQPGANPRFQDASTNAVTTFGAQAVTNNIVAASVTTFSPTDKNASFTLSGGNLIATNSGSAWTAARGTTGKTSGKWYFEMSFAGSNRCVLGIGTAAAGLASFAGADAEGWGLINTTGVLYSGAANVLPGSPAPFNAGDVIGIALDATAHTLRVYINGVAAGSAAVTVSSSALFPMASSEGTDVITANFGATAFAFAPPAGFSAWG